MITQRGIYSCELAGTLHLIIVVTPHSFNSPTTRSPYCFSTSLHFNIHLDKLFFLFTLDLRRQTLRHDCAESNADELRTTIGCSFGALLPIDVHG